MTKKSEKEVKKEGVVYKKRCQTWNLVALALQQIFCLRSRLGVAQWSLAPNKKFAQPPCQTPNF